MPTITVRDETTSGKTVGELSLDLLTEELTARELIRARVYQEVQDFNRTRTEIFRGLVQPTGAEATLNGFKMRDRREIDWKPQFEKACEAFEGNRILILVGDRQVESLDERLTLRAEDRVSFLKLVPLVGG